MNVRIAFAVAGFFFLASAGGLQGSPADNASAGRGPAHLALVKKGKSDFAIVIDRDASPVVRFAASELQKYIKEISGAELRVTHDAPAGGVICVGPSATLGAEMEELGRELRGRGEDGYLIRGAGKRIVLVGNSARATLYAVYRFLEKQLDCGWCAPGDDTVPQRKTIELAEFSEAVGPPLFAMRQIILFPYGGELLRKNNLPHTDWLAKNGFNWAHPAPNGPYSWERNKSREIFVPEVKNRGLYLEVGGHTFNTWLPADKYAKEHPDYYALTKSGARAAGSTHEAGLCISNPAVVRQVAENMIRWLDENPEVDAVDLWHNDSFTFCRCPQCTPKDAGESGAAAAYTKTYIHFVNQVADQVARRHPRILVNLLAYAHTTDCPAGAEPLGEHVLVGLCLFPRPSQRTMRPLETSPQRLDTNLRAQIPAWRKLAKHFYIYEYYTFSPNEKVWSMVSMLHEDVPFLARCRADGISSDQFGPYWYPLNMYAFGKLMWNPGLRPDEIIADFCRRYYGRASESMIAYWSLLEEGLRESWQTERPVDWRDAKRRDCIKKALSEAENPQISARIRAAAALHKLALDRP